MLTGKAHRDRKFVAFIHVPDTAGTSETVTILDTKKITAAAGLLERRV